MNAPLQLSTTDSESPSRLRRSRMEFCERRQQLLDAATAVFASKGFNGATTKEIAAAAGITEALIFRHFASKELLYDAVIELGVDRSRRPEWRASLIECMETDNDEGFFRHLIEFLIEIHRSDPQFQRLLIYATLEGHHLALRHVHQVVGPLYKKLSDYVTRRQHAGALCKGDAFGVVTSVLGLARNYAVSKYIYQQEVPRLSDNDAIEMFLRIAMNGVINRKKRKTRRGYQQRRKLLQ